MEILIKPKMYKGCERWHPKMFGVVLIEKQEDIYPLWKILCEQDDYWDHYLKLIKVAPKEIDDLETISEMCEYVGKTDIYDPVKINEQIPFIMHQEYPKQSF